MRKVLIVMLLLVLIFTFWWHGAFSYFADISQLRADIEELGAFGPLLYFVVFFTAYLIGFHPGLVWISGFIWPLPLAILYANLAGLLSGMIVFWITRRFSQRWATNRLPERIRRYEAKLEKNPTKTLSVLRLLLWINILTDVLIGVSKISSRQYFVASLIIIPPITTIHILIAKYGYSAFNG